MIKTGKKNLLIFFLKTPKIRKIFDKKCFLPTKLKTQNDRSHSSQRNHLLILDDDDRRSSNDSRTCLITSFAGTGKTMLLKEIEQLANQVAASRSSSSMKIHYQHINAAEMMIGNRGKNNDDNRILGNVIEVFSSAITIAKNDLKTAVVLCIDDVDCFFGSSI
jgi:hypothetical protein